VNVRLWTNLALAAALFAATPSLSLRAEDDVNVKQIPTGDSEMASAAAKARSGLDDFLAKLENPPSGTEAYSVKIGMKDDGDGIIMSGDANLDGGEYFWIGDIVKDGEGYRGTLNNEPQFVRNLRKGQPITFGRNNIFDWMYFEDGKMKGNATSCPLLLRSAPEELAFYRDNYGLEC
jgi:uncharacterized protein YegJ (DUF2314 family)